MKGLVLHSPFISRGTKLPLLPALVGTLPCSATISRKTISPPCKLSSNFSSFLDESFFIFYYTELSCSLQGSTYFIWFSLELILHHVEFEMANWVCRI